VNIRAIADIVVTLLFGGGPPKLYRQRSCQGRAWLRRFPAASVEIRAFLETFAEAFAYRDKAKLLFHPDDSIYAIYRAQYPSLGWGDSLELETLNTLVQRKYRLALSTVWSESLTLGQLFEATRKQ
jgi:propanediol dehydratase small subunit